jgi:DNA/RNA endonuclease G (NUC1)
MIISNTNKHKKHKTSKSNKKNKIQNTSKKYNLKSSSNKSIKIHKHKSKYSSKKVLKLNTLKLHKLKFNNNYDKNITYKDVFTNKNINKDIVFLKKQLFDIFYSKKYKYPLLVRELLTKLTGFGEKKIIRSEHEDYWSNDSNIPLNNSLTLNDYNTYEYYGGSLGHNAPAGWHKFNMSDYKETFILTNITPQSHSLNTGYWNMLEYFCKQLQHNKDLSNVNIFTGSIINTKNSLMYNAKLEEISINIPKYMFKIVCFNHLNYPNITFLDIFIFHNKFYKLNINKKNINFTNYLLPIKSYNWFENNTGINILNLLKFYNINNHTIKSFKTIINLNLHINEKNKLYSYVKGSYYTSSLYDVSTLDELYHNYSIFQSHQTFILEDNLFISNIFCKVRNKLIRDAILYTNFKNLNQFNEFFSKLQNDLNTKFYISKKTEITYLDISQDEYLNNYYNIVLKKNKWNNL